jgi:hypothetical protein
MSLSAPSVSFTIVDGGLSEAPAAPLDGPMWILGPTSSGTAEDPFTTTQAATVKSTFGHGPAVEAALQALNKNITQVTLMRVDPTGGTDGVYGTITVNSQGAGITVTGDGTVKPGDDWEPIVRWTAGGTIGVTGIEYEYSLDNGGKYSGPRELGTDTSITLPNGGGKYNLVGLELSTLITRVAEARTDFLGHTGESPTYHTVVDPNAPYAVTTPIDDATVLTACANLRTHALTHVAVVAGTHGVVDTTAQTALTALVNPTTRAEAIVFIEAFIDIFFGTGTANSGHSIRTTSAIHAAADITNVITSSPAVAGDVVAGDTFSLTTTAPRWSIDALLAALDVFNASVAPFNGLLEIVGPILTSAEAQAIEDKLESFSTKNRDVRAIGHFRMRNAGETQQAYVNAYKLAHPIAASSGRRGRLALTGSWYQPSQLVPGATSPRPWSFSIAPRLARNAYAEHPIYEATVGTFSGALRAANGTTVLPRACDEDSEPIFTPARLWVPMTKDSKIVSSIGVTLAEDGSDFAQIQYGRIIDAVKRFEQIELKKRLGQQVAPKPGTVVIDPNEKKRIEKAEEKKLIDAFGGSKGQILRARVVIDPASVVSGAGSKIVYVDVYVTPPGYIEIIVGRLQFAL